MNSNVRLNLIILGPAADEREWTPARETSRLMFLDALAALDEVLDVQLDVERIVLEAGSAAASEFLSLLARVGNHFSGDVLFVERDGRGFLSSNSRGGDRVLYELSSSDVAFYLRVHKLTAPLAVSTMPNGEWVSDASQALTA
jgi:hypothetical protein